MSNAHNRGLVYGRLGTTIERGDANGLMVRLFDYLETLPADADEREQDPFDLADAWLTDQGLDTWACPFSIRNFAIRIISDWANWQEESR